MRWTRKKQSAFLDPFETKTKEKKALGFTSFFCKPQAYIQIIPVYLMTHFDRLGLNYHQALYVEMWINKK